MLIFLRGQTFCLEILRKKKYKNHTKITYYVLNMKEKLKMG